jgi:putative endopeptidase
MNKYFKLLIMLTGIFSLLTLSFCGNKKSEIVEEKALNLADMDTTINPTEDFFMYANGGWMKNNPLPEDRARFGTFDQLALKADKQVKVLVEDIAENENEQGSISQKIGDFYSLGMDSAKIEEDGLKPLEGEFEKIESIETKTDLINYISYAHAHGIRPLFGMFGSIDSKNSEMVVAHLWQGGLGMPDRDYYTNDDNRSKELREAYLKHVKNMFELAGCEKAESHAALIMKLETQLAASSMTRLQMRDPHATYHKMTIKTLAEMTPGTDWLTYVNGLEVGDPGEIIVGQPEFFKTVDKMLSEVSIDDWKVYLKWHLLNNTANYLNEAFVNEHFEFFGKALGGTPQLRPRWQRVLDVTSSSLSEAIGQKYVEKHFPPEAKSRMQELVGNIKVALGERINNLEWMSEETKVKAHEKIETMNVKIGYPDKWRDYSNLEIKDDAYVLNVLRSKKFNYAYNLSKINKPVDKDEWHMPPQMVNAYYSPEMNEMVFPAAILQPPFFYMDADDAVNYGAIGMVISHEMTHGFDDQGRQYDKDGNLNDWWTEEDAKRFKERTQVLVDQFNGFTVLDTIQADGELTLGENIADLGGLNISYTAFMKTMEGKEKQLISGFTPEQRFFLAYAHVWAQNIRDKEILRRTKEDVHSLGYWRVNGPLPNMPEFHAAFDIKEGDKMYLPEDKRAVIW